MREDPTTDAVCTAQQSWLGPSLALLALLAGCALFIALGLAQTHAGPVKAWTLELVVDPTASSTSAREVSSAEKQLQARARQAALASPTSAGEDEHVSALALEQLANDIERPRPSRQQRAALGRVLDAVEQSGGRLLQGRAQLGLTFLLSDAAVRELRRLPEVSSLLPAVQPVSANSIYGGSQTWFDNDFTGQAPNAEFGGEGAAQKHRAADAPSGGPDVGIIDQGGVTTPHVAFNTRLPGDCSSCIGTGPRLDPNHTDAEAGAHTRVVSPPHRTQFSGGGKHADMIAATIARTDMRLANGEGMAYGLDKLYDATLAEDSIGWVLGYNLYRDFGYTRAGRDFNEDGVTDLPEVINYSQGTYDDGSPTGGALGLKSGSLGALKRIDGLVDTFNIQWVNAAGNCGAPVGGCDDGTQPVIHRIGAEAANHNALTVGGVMVSSPDHHDWAAWEGSSPGPTYDGRKKPDLVAHPLGAGGQPLYYDADSNGQFDDYGAGLFPGTSASAPRVVSAVTLLASVGVTDTMAQRAVLINTALPVQNQTYWTPTTGWGALNFDGAFEHRAHYATGEVTAGGANGVRFFRQSGVVAGDRTTLAWNRHFTHPYQPYAWAGNYLATTNLDLIQFDPTSCTLASCPATATGGSDAADSVDINQTATTDPIGTDAPTDNPKPGSGDDGEDTVEQVRATGSGTQVFKVKAIGPIDGAETERFALAGNHTIEEVAAPVPQLTLQLDHEELQRGSDAQLTIKATNPADELALEGAEITLDPLPAGLSAAGSTSWSLGNLAATSNATRSTTVETQADGTYAITAHVSGAKWGENFAADAQITLTVDGTAPDLSISSWPQWSTTASPVASWSATDEIAGGVTYDVELRRGGGAWSPLLTATTDETVSVPAAEGETVALRVRASDRMGNTSSWQQISTTVDAIPPEIVIGTPVLLKPWQVQMSVSVSNVGSPVSTTYSWSAVGGGDRGALTSSVVSFSNDRRTPQWAGLSVTAVDGLGRTVQKHKSVRLAARYKRPGLKLKRPKTGRRTLTISGTINRSWNGKVQLELTGRGPIATKRVKRTVKVKAGRFQLRLRVRSGSWRIRASVPARRDFLAMSALRHTRVR